MQALSIIGTISAVLAAVWYMIKRAKTDAVISQLSRPDRTEEIKEIATLTKEVETAKIVYSDARRDLEKTLAAAPPPEPEPEPEVVPRPILTTPESVKKLIDVMLKNLTKEPTDETPPPPTSGIELNHLMAGPRAGDVQRSRKGEN